MNILSKEKKIKELEAKVKELHDEKLICILNDEISEYKNNMMKDLTAWDRVQIARHSDRPIAPFYINEVFDDFIELHGDKLYSDDSSIIGGIGIINGISVTVIAQQKGKSTEENIKRNFGMPHPEGYRKSLRLMKQAEKFRRPIITFIDTPGAYPGLGAEERGQGEAIARNLLEMSKLTVPVIAVVIGEGGSGGALALGVANKVYMLENSIYSILSPEGYATILWKDASLADKAANIMKLTSYDLLDFGIIDGIIKEPIGGAHINKIEACKSVKEQIIDGLDELLKLSTYKLREERYTKYRKFGFYQRFNYENLK